MCACVMERDTRRRRIEERIRERGEKKERGKKKSLETTQMQKHDGCIKLF